MTVTFGCFLNRRAGAQRLHDPGSSGRRRRDLPWLHLRLQLLLDYRDARAQFHLFIDRVLADIRDASRPRRPSDLLGRRQHHPQRPPLRSTLPGDHRRRLNHLDYTVQAMTSAIANSGETLAPLMREAGFRYVFLGIENVLEEDLDFPARPLQEPNASGCASSDRLTLHRNKMYVVGGLIVGNPDDTRETSPRIWSSRGATSIGPTSSTRPPIHARR